MGKVIAFVLFSSLAFAQYAPPGGSSGGGGGSGCVGTAATPCVVAGTAATGAAISGAPVLVATSDGVLVRQPFVCTLRAAIALTASGSTQIIAASGATQIRICHIDWLTTAAVNVKIVQGTGANCVTSPADMTGLYTGAGAFSLAMDYTPDAALTTTASQAVCVNQSGAVTTGGTVIYAQY